MQGDFGSDTMCTLEIISKDMGGGMNTYKSLFGYDARIIGCLHPVVETVRSLQPPVKVFRYNVREGAGYRNTRRRRMRG